VSATLGQTLRFGVVRTTAQSCTADLVFHNSQGVVVAQKRVALEPGHSDFLDLNMTQQVPRFGERGLYLPCVQPVAAGSSDGCIGSVQVFDQFTGWTTTFAGVSRQ
jgi:hypothetical protein